MFDPIIAINSPNIYETRVPIAAPIIPNIGINKYENKIFKIAIEKVNNESNFVLLK